MFVEPSFDIEHLRLFDVEPQHGSGSASRFSKRTPDSFAVTANLAIAPTPDPSAATYARQFESAGSQDGPSWFQRLRAYTWSLSRHRWLSLFYPFVARL